METAFRRFRLYDVLRFVLAVIARGTPLSIALLLGAARLGTTQAPLARSCVKCELVVQRLSSWHGSRFPLISDYPRDAVVDTRGRLYVIAAEAELPVVLATDGMSRLLGSRTGPAAIQMPSALALDRSDVLHVFDRMGYTRILPSGEVAGRSRFAYAGTIRDALVLERQQVLVNGEFRDQDAAGTTLQLFEHSRGRLAAFAAPSEPMDMRRPQSRARTLARRAAGGVYVFRTLSYEVQVYDDRWQLIRSFRPQTEDFVEHKAGESFVPSSDMSRPPQAVVGGWELSDRYLTVAFHVPADGWQAAAKGGDFLAVYDTMVHVIDVASAQIVARRRFPGHAFAVARPGLLATYDKVDGISQVEVWSVTFNP